MSRSIPERYVWAVDILDVQPNDIILEIGCGHGHSIPLIFEKLRDGHLTANDRSAKMVAVATQSYKELIVSGNVTVMHQDLLDRDLPASHFDKIFLFNVNVFWMDPIAELAEIRRLLRPQGRFFLFHQPPPGHDLAEFEAAFCTNLQKYGFKVIERFGDERDAVRSTGLVAAPNPL